MAYTTIKKPSDYFNTKLYTGNASTNAITGIGHQPDMVWLKSRSFAQNHEMYDAVRTATKRLYPNGSFAEDTNSTGLTAFNSDGFTLGSSNAINKSGDTFVSWNWKANGSGSSNTTGSINSTVSANTTAGFSIVSYTGTGSNATVGHGLGVAPSMMIVKQRNSTENWTVYHSSIGNPAQYMELNRDVAVLTNSLVWNSTNPTSSVFSIGTNARTNNNTSTYIAYCFAKKKGFSRFGSYVGNGSSDGSYIHLGFKPAFYIIKRTDTTGAWIIKDNLRPGYNVNGSYLVANDTIAEATGSGNVASDEVSNGFKIRGTSSALNTSGGTYIYMAFAENPFVTSTGIPSCAR